MIRLSRLTESVVAAACLLAVGAMLRYPGGTVLDHASRSYSLPHNFLSDLGMTVAYDGRANRLGAALFIASLLTLVVGLGHALVVIARTLSGHPDSRRWARGALACGLVACVAFTGVSVTPENRVMGVHLAFTIWAWRVMPAVAFLLGVASFKSAELPRRATVMWFALGGILVAYAVLLSWGPRIRTEDGLVFQVLAQKVVTVAVVATLVLVTRDFDRLNQPTR